QRDLVRVHAIEGIHTVEVGGNELVILIVGKYGLRAQRIDGLYNISIAIIDITCVLTAPSNVYGLEPG
ncbi:hypothetical protein AAAV73_12015, partial [Hominicoprocola fusiformis]